jgi:phosphate starvation-inducible protein PhoH and related proteins
MKEAPKPDLCSHSISYEDVDPLALLGPADANLNALSRHFRTRIVARAGNLNLSGPKEEEQALLDLIYKLISRCRSGEPVSPEFIDAEAGRLTRVYARPEVRSAKSEPRGSAFGVQNSELSSACEPDTVSLKTPRKTIVAKTRNQRTYLGALERNDIIFAIGPAGTGKTYLAVAAALSSLVAGRSSRIVLTRPAVEAGESLGYLPGSFKDKVDPYLRPLYDALFDMMPMERTQRLIEQEVIEVAPLAFMRGRTLSDAYIILDEAQNTTSTQMRMFLTRLGWNSKAIVTGDVTQIDLAAHCVSGLVEASDRLTGVPGIAIIRLTEADVVRPPLVSRIIRAYDRTNGEDRPRE